MTEPMLELNGKRRHTAEPLKLSGSSSVKGRLKLSHDREINISNETVECLFNSYLCKWSTDEGSRFDAIVSPLTLEPVFSVLSTYICQLTLTSMIRFRLQIVSQNESASSHLWGEKKQQNTPS